jgi:hypothetical protein
MSMEIARTAPAGLAATDPAELARVVESLVVRGDISALSIADRSRYYMKMCESLGLNPHAQPLAFLKLNGKEVLYVTRGATDQLAAMHRLNRKMVDGPKVIDLGGTKVVYAVCEATHPNGRTETAIATLPFTDPVNVYMKAETKAKRRATLSILGLGLLDETELETIPASAMGPATQAVLPAETEDRPEDSSAAMAEYITALEGADRPSQVRAAYLALQDGLRGERKDPSDWTKTAHAEALSALRVMKWAPTAAELGQLLGAGAESFDLAAMLDKPTGLDPAALPLWWMGHKDAVQQLHKAHQGIVWRLIACKHAGLAGDPDGAATKRATAGLKTAIAELPVEAPPATVDPDAPFPRGEPGDDDGDDEPPTAPQSPTRSRRSTATAAGTTADAAAPEGPAAWLSDDDAAMAHAAGWTHARHVEASVRRHGAGLVGPAAERLVRVATARLEALTADTDGTRMTAEGLRRMAARWAAQGPVVRRAA